METQRQPFAAGSDGDAASESQTLHEPVVGAGRERGGSSSFDEPTSVSNQPQRDMSEFMACQMEPWDGPAMVGFTDGVIVPHWTATVCGQYAGV